MVYGSMRPFLKMLLLYLEEWAWRNALNLIFLIRDRLFVFLVGGGGGGGADFFQQLKLDFLYRQSESIFIVIQLSTIAISPYTLV